MPKLMVDINNKELNKKIEIDKALKGYKTKQETIVKALKKHYDIKD